MARRKGSKDKNKRKRRSRAISAATQAGFLGGAALGGTVGGLGYLGKRKIPMAVLGAGAGSLGLAVGGNLGYRGLSAANRFLYQGNADRVSDASSASTPLLLGTVGSGGLIGHRYGGKKGAIAGGLAGVAGTLYLGRKAEGYVTGKRKRFIY